LPRASQDPGIERRKWGGMCTGIWQWVRQPRN
jgi:hypothetical protein